MKRLLVACEFSGVVRDAFTARGWDAWSCDLRPSETPGQHFECDISRVLFRSLKWDMLIAFPPCTDLCVSGARWFAEKRKDGRQQASVDFFLMFAHSGISKICIENPVGIMSTLFRKPDQIIQPWQFGHGETKATCLWLKNLPKLAPTNIVDGREPRIHMMPPGPERERERSRTYHGIAQAMADQWSNL
jgi:site-specific DNA-cytosine methylase